MKEIHIPEGINYECTGCGNCCLTWPVPLTDADHLSLSNLTCTELQQARLSQPLFRPLNSKDPKLNVFTHTLEKRSDGKCEFLTQENQCWLHLKYGPKMKPAMCQLFPYTFNHTPSGVYASLSFASTGVLLNSGRALTDQEELLQQKWDLFCRLFSKLSIDWSNIQLIDGRPLKWDAYMHLDRQLLRLVKVGDCKRVDKMLTALSHYLVSELPRGTNLEKPPPIKARAKIVDQFLLKSLFDLYLPEDAFASQPSDFDSQTLLKNLIEPPEAVRLSTSGKTRSFQELIDLALGELDQDSEALLWRFIYCRLFAKLYFGPGFANLSVLAGIHHLLVLIVLVRLRLKLSALTHGQSKPSFLETVEIVRTLEQRLTQVSLSKESAVILEVLLTSPERMQRLLFLSS